MSTPNAIDQSPPVFTSSEAIVSALDSKPSAARSTGQEVSANAAPRRGSVIPTPTALIRIASSPQSDGDSGAKFVDREAIRLALSQVQQAYVDPDDPNTQSLLAQGIALEIYTQGDVDDALLGWCKAAAFRAATLNISSVEEIKLFAKIERIMSSLERPKSEFEALRADYDVQRDESAYGAILSQIRDKQRHLEIDRFPDPIIEVHMKQAVDRGLINPQDAERTKADMYRRNALSLINFGILGYSPKFDPRKEPAKRALADAKAIGALTQDEVDLTLRAYRYDHPPGNRRARALRIAGRALLKGLGFLVTSPFSAISGALWVLAAISLPVPIPGSTFVFAAPALLTLWPAMKIWEWPTITREDDHRVVPEALTIPEHLRLRF